jgi:hypothetical protein
MAPYGRKLRMDYSQSAPGRLQRYLAEKEGTAGSSDGLAAVGAAAAIPTLAPEQRVWRSPELEAQEQAQAQEVTQAQTDAAESADAYSEALGEATEAETTGESQEGQSQGEKETSSW